MNETEYKKLTDENEKQAGTYAGGTNSALGRPRGTWAAILFSAIILELRLTLEMTSVFTLAFCLGVIFQVTVKENLVKSNSLLGRGNPNSNHKKQPYLNPKPNL